MQQREFTTAMAKELNVGDKVPDLTVQCVWCGKFTLSEKVKTSPVLLYFYPANYGMQCISYSEFMSDYHDDLERIGVTVFHVNPDTLENHEKYMKRLGTRYDHMADTDGNVCRIFGMLIPSPLPGFRDVPGRGFALIDKEMVLRYIWRAPSPILLLDIPSLVTELGDILNK
ncbi:MAG: peroxiredoxin family protein [Methanomassiliicoccaceae archaeon]|nr:peroxiredoxin family protein [Methanomassiliicoccaceae archaeon]